MVRGPSWGQGVRGSGAAGGIPECALGGRYVGARPSPHLTQAPSETGSVDPGLGRWPVLSISAVKCFECPPGDMEGKTEKGSQFYGRGN